MKNEINISEYKDWLKGIKNRIAASRIKAALAVNNELIELYWFLGAQIVDRQHTAHWGSSFINQFSKDLKSEFADVAGFSPKNLRYCRAFYNFYSQPEIWQQAVAKLEIHNKKDKWQQDVAENVSSDINKIIPQFTGKIPWGHNIHIFTKSTDFDEAFFYINETINNGWSRDILALQIKSNLFARQGNAISNFTQTLPPPQSDLATQTIKDPYNFDFLTLVEPYNERDIENQLCEHITKFLLELGKGFAFVGRQYPLEVADSEYFMDLLFYHIKLKCYVVVELKNTKFKPEYTGKLNFYLSAVDDLIKDDTDAPTIGILLCRDKNNIEVEFALRDMNKPMGVSEFTLTEILPDELKTSLPSIEDIEADFFINMNIE